jgi:inorganic pyrophosphatase
VSIGSAKFPFTALAFLVGAITSIISGYIGMRIAVYTNTRTTFQCCKGDWIDNGRGEKIKNLKDGFFTAFRGGQVLGFVLVGLALLILDILLIIYKKSFRDVNQVEIKGSNYSM